ncbi:MAG: immune inhibitor A [Thermoplasmata archaeon]
MSEATTESKGSRRKVLLALFVVTLLVATAFSVTALVTQRSRAEQLSEIPLYWQRYVNGAIERGDIPKDASPAQVKDWLAERIPNFSDKVKNSYVNPFAAKRVAEAEAAAASGVVEPPAVTGTGKILVILVEFAGTDTYRSETFTGPLHNQIPQPAPENNVDYWAPDFSTEHFEKLLFGSEGLTLKKYYEEQSNGMFTVDGYVSAWVQIKDHSEWWYGADSRTGGEGSDDLNGPVWRLAADAAQAAYDAYGESIPWADFDADGDGWIDSLMVVNAGVDQSAGGPSWAVWAHSWFVNWPYGYTLPNGIKIGSYTTEPENEAVGVYAHEYGHQLGLPDEYDVTYLGESPVGFLSLMASGSWGPGMTPDGRMALGVSPAHIDVWGKYVLGWENGATVYIDYSSQKPVSKTIKLSQVEGGGKTRAVKVELPRQAVALPLPKPKTGEYQLYSGYKPDVTDVMAPVETSTYDLVTAKAIPIPASGATLSFYEWYEIESYYDWASVWASGDGGVTWTTLPGRTTTTADPFGGNPGYGITGSSKRYVLESMDLSAYAGKSVLLRFRLQQDGAVYGLGWTLDDIVVKDGTGAVLFQDLVSPESASNWVFVSSDDMGPGWSIASATTGGSFRHYYIAEWRNFVGFDATLATSYQFVGLYVQFWSHTPGLLVWYRNFAVGDNSVGLHPGKVAIGVVDAHPEPLLMANNHYVRQRIQLMDAAFGLRPTIGNTITLLGVPTTFGPLPAVPTFDDSRAYFYSQFYKGVYEYTGLKITSYGVKIGVLSERPGLTGATIAVSAAPM